MKILVSSKHLYEKLSEIDFYSDKVVSASVSERVFTITTSTKQIYLHSEPIAFVRDKYIRQESRRWDFVKKLVDSVGEQPIVLEIYEGVTNVIFQY